MGRLKKQNLPRTESTIVSSAARMRDGAQVAGVEVASSSPRRSFRKSSSKLVPLEVSPRLKAPGTNPVAWGSHRKMDSTLAFSRMRPGGLARELRGDQL